MKELRKKTTITLFFIFTAILVASFLIMNIRNYEREYEGIDRNLNILENKGGRMDNFPGGGGPQPEGRGFKPRELENTRIMDYEVYTVEIEDSQVTEIFNHGNSSEDFDVWSIADHILEEEKTDRFSVGNLYLNGYSYKYKYKESIVILNHVQTAQKLRGLLLESLIAFILLDVVFFFLAKLITNWIVAPAKEAFSKQKEFIADASHELKTPLAVIMASSDELNAGTDRSDPNHKYIDHIRYETDRMNRLIQGLLNLSRLEDGNTKDTYKSENLSKILEKSCLAYEGVAFEQGVGIEEDIEENMEFTCNKDEMEKMISTILDNAVKHSYKDTSVRVSGQGVRGGILIKVINAGDPIKEEDRDKIFERFYRADKSRAREDNRYGLGLAIAKQIVLNHNGTIKAYSADGDTTFEIFLKRGK